MAPERRAPGGLICQYPDAGKKCSTSSATPSIDKLCNKTLSFVAAEVTRLKFLGSNHLFRASLRRLLLPESVWKRSTCRNGKKSAAASFDLAGGTF
jgi:hypothetical protein